MKVKIEIEIPDKLLAEINELIKDLGISLNELAEMALREWLQKHRNSKSDI